MPQQHYGCDHYQRQQNPLSLYDRNEFVRHVLN
jgi:hypothetical protein